MDTAGRDADRAQGAHGRVGHTGRTAQVDVSFRDVRDVSGECRAGQGSA
jgi:hypothetical protein